MEDHSDSGATPPRVRTLKADITKNILADPTKPLTAAGVKKLARLGSKRAVERIILGIESSNEFVAVKCAKETLDRGFGKAEQNLAIKGEIAHTGYSAELRALARGLYQDKLISTKPEDAPAPDIVDAEFETIEISAADNAEKDGSR